MRKLNHSAARPHEKNLWRAGGGEVGAEAGHVLLLEMYIVLVPSLQGTLNYYFF